VVSHPTGCGADLYAPTNGDTRVWTVTNKDRRVMSLGESGPRRCTRTEALPVLDGSASRLAGGDRSLARQVGLWQVTLMRCVHGSPHRPSWHSRLRGVPVTGANPGVVHGLQTFGCCNAHPSSQNVELALRHRRSRRPRAGTGPRRRARHDSALTALSRLPEGAVGGMRAGRLRRATSPSRNAA